MQIETLLRPEAVKSTSMPTSRKRLMHYLGEMGHTLYGIDEDRAVEALCERETLGPTAIGGGIAIPHARVNGLDVVKGAFLRLGKPLDLSAADQQPVDLVFALFAPLDANVEHLRALALVARTLRDKQTCGKLRANDDPSTLYTILTEARPSRAA